ncbi:MAG: STAS domain-containing protein [Sporichthyaceae bacterium]
MLLTPTFPETARPERRGIFVVGHSVVLTGAVDREALGRLGEALTGARRAAVEAGEALQVDLSRVTRLDAAAVMLLRRYAGAGLRLVCRRPSPVARAAIRSGLVELPQVQVRWVD